MTTDTIIAYTTGPYTCARGSCGHVHATREAAEACIADDNRGCASQGGYSDRRVVELTQAEALALPRVPWALLHASGADLDAISQEARANGDEVLYRRARRAARGLRRG